MYQFQLLLVVYVSMDDVKSVVAPDVGENPDLRALAFLGLQNGIGLLRLIL